MSCGKAWMCQLQPQRHRFKKHINCVMWESVNVSVAASETQIQETHKLCHVGKRECVSCSVVSTLCNPMDCSQPGSSVHGIIQARILELVAIPFPGIFPTQWSNPGFPRFRQILYHLSHQVSDYKTEEAYQDKACKATVSYISCLPGIMIATGKK